MLLLMSWIVVWQFPAQEEPGIHERETLVFLPEQEEPVKLRYHHISGDNSGVIPFVMLPDELRDAADLLPLAESVAEMTGSDVIIPVYPHTDASGKRISLSIEGRGDVIMAFLDSLEFSSMHLAGYRYGGLVSSHLASENETGNFESLTLISSMGIEEMHFLGNYRINRSLYALLLPVISVYKYAFPHFGSYHNQQLTLDYLSAMLELDQRGVEETLRNIRLPVLILHPEQDSFVPLHTAQEIFRLIPQSRLEVPEKSAESITTDPDLWAGYIHDFYLDLDEGSALTRDEADPDRAEKSEAPFDQDDIDPLAGWALLTIILLLMFSTLISEDLACIAGGLLVATGIIQFQYAVMGCFMGILLADVSIYWLGRLIGSPVLGWVPFKWFIKERDIEWAENMFEMRGAEIIFATRFLPGTRFPTYLAAGMIKTSFSAFLAYFVAAIAIWTPLLVGVSALIGQPMLGFLEMYQEYALIVVILFFMLIYAILKYLLPLTTIKGRRRFYVKWIRLRERLTGEERR
jgi:membrane protein DedA with SNARE-associated domain/esterase/lipase